MNDKPRETATQKAADAREERLKAALKANMAKRKAQSRARAADAPTDGDAGGNE